VVFLLINNECIFCERVIESIPYAEEHLVFAFASFDKAINGWPGYFNPSCQFSLAHPAFKPDDFNEFT
jgi:hypothetical protein